MCALHSRKTQLRNSTHRSTHSNSEGNSLSRKKSLSQDPIFIDDGFEVKSELGITLRAMAENKKKHLSAKRMPIKNSRTLSTLSCGKKKEINNIGIIISEKIKTLKITVIPDQTIMHIVVPINSPLSVKEVEGYIRTRLENIYEEKVNIHPIDFDNYYLHLSGIKLAPHEVISLRWNDSKKWTFNPVLKDCNVNSPRKFVRKQLSKLGIVDSPKSGKISEPLDFKKQNMELSLLKDKIEDLKAKNPYYPKKIEEIKILGKGASAVVKSCYVDGWLCAMKEMDIDEDSNTKEISILEKLPPNDNFVQYFFHKKTSTKLQIFLKQYSGTLRELIVEKKKEGDQFTPRQITKILCNIACGLRFLHKHKVIHRDLKSDNIFYQYKGNDIVCAIGDLDTAKLISSSAKAKTIIGTPAFIAPEVLTSKNENPYSSKADVFSFGMITFELLALELPFMEISKSWLISQAIIKGNLPKLPPLGDEYNELIDIFKLCLDVDPKLRPKSSRLYSRLKQMKAQYKKINDK